MELQLVGILCLFFSVVFSEDFKNGIFEEDTTADFEPDLQNFLKVGEQEPIDDIPYALSPIHLISLSRKEEQLYYLLEDYERELIQRLTIIQNFKADYEESSLKFMNELNPDTNEWDKHSQIAANPILSHRMIRRFTNQMTDFREHLFNTIDLTIVWQRMEQLKENLNWPTISDLTDSINSIIRLTEIHGINVTKFTGIIDSYDELLEPRGHFMLNAIHCTEIADTALNRELPILASDFIKTAYHKVLYENDPTADLSVISEMWRNAVEMQAAFYETEPTEDLIEITRTAEIKEYESEKGNLVDHNSHYNYMALCRGEEFQPEQVKAKLYCWHETERNAYWKINPQRMELRSSDPFLVEIHDFVGINLIQSLIFAFIPIMSFPERSTVAKDQQRQTSSVRTSVTGWLSEDQVREQNIKDFSKKIEFITGLHVIKPFSSESHQMSSYTYGGHYLPHLDALSSGNFTNEIGERMATFILYLDDTFPGSDTVFTRLGVASRPTKGSALFWYNLHKNGSTDERMLHGGCPIREGFKMITTKWIFDKANFLKRQCSRNENE